MYHRYRKSISPATPDGPTRIAWDRHGDEKDLRDACEKLSCGVPMTDQVLDLLGLELMDLS